MHKIIPKGLRIRKTIIWNLLLVIVIYLWANQLYFEVNPLVNYMWKLELNFSNRLSIIHLLMLSFLVLTGPTSNTLEKHFFLILIIGIYIPITILSNHTSTGQTFSFIVFLSILGSNFCYRLMNRFFRFRHTINITGYRILSVDRFLQFNFVISFILIGFLIISNKDALLSFNIFNTFANIYDIRAENTLTGLIAYFPGWIVGISVPILVASFLIRNDWKSLILSFIGIYLIFQVFAMKIHLFSLILLLVFGLIFKYFKVIKEVLVEMFFLIVFASANFSGGLIYAFLDRFFYLPGQLNIHYYEFFSQNPKNYFTGSKLGFLFNKSAYGKPMGFVIDDKFYGGGMNANTGYLASTYGDLGIPGIIIATFLIALILYFLNILFKKTKYIGYLIAIQIAFALVNAPLNDLFLTNGTLFVLFIALLIKTKIMMSQSSNSQNSKQFAN